MPFVVLLGRLVLAAVFGVAGISKLLDREGSRTAMREFGVPASLVPALAALLPLVELSCATALLAPAAARYGAAAALSLLALFIVGISVSLARGRRPHCRCFGQLSSATVGWPTVARNALLASIAVFLVFNRAEASASTVGLSSTAVLVLALVAQTVLFVIALGYMLRQNGRLMLRLEAVEAKLGIAAAAEPIPAGLSIGTVVPDSGLATLEGARTSLREAVNPGKTLLLFIEPDCNACDAVLPDLSRWEREHAHAFQVVVVSRGDAEANRTKFATATPRMVLLQRDREVAEAHHVGGVPAALLVEAGRIASPVAGGADAIRTLADLALKPTPLQPGDSVPTLVLRKLDGGTQDLRELPPRDTVLLFWNPTCGYCQRMLDDVTAWERERSDRHPELIVVSAGSPQANREQGFRSQVLLDAKFLASERFGVEGTPSAVLVAANGQVASGVRVGAPSVLSLLGAPAVMTVAV